jgi:hypothetical protein
MSATRTQARMDNLAVGLVAAGSPLRLPFDGKARMAPYGCSAVNWPEMSSTRAGRPRQSRERQIKEAVSLVAPLALYDDARLLELPRGDQATLTSASVSAPMAPSFFLAVSAARRAAHTGQEADGITAGCVHGTSGRRLDAFAADAARNCRLGFIGGRSRRSGQSVIQSSACRRMARGCGDCATTRLLDHRPFHGGSRRQERLAQPQTRPARTIWRRNIRYPMQRSGTRQTLCALVRRRGNGEADCGWPLPHARCGERIKF